MDITLAELLAPWIRIGLALLWISGIGFIAHYLAYTPDLLANPKLHAKIVVVCALTLNGVLVERYAFAELSSREGKTLIQAGDGHQLHRLLAVGAVSATSWYTPLLFGAVRELNFAFAMWVYLVAWVAAGFATYLCLYAWVWLWAHSKSIAEFGDAAPLMEPAQMGPSQVSIS